MKLTGLQLKNSKRISYCSPFIPAEWIAAHGLVPHYKRPDGTNRNGVIDNRAGICAYMRAFVNECIEDPGTDAVVVTTTCDQMRRSLDLTEGATKKPIFLFHVPATWQTPSTHKYYASELTRLGRFLVGLGGKAPDTAGLAKTMRRFQSARGEILADPSKSAGQPLTEALNHFYETGEIPGPGLEKSPGIPIAVLGGPLSRTDCTLLDLVEQLGGTVVLDGTENGERTLPAAFNARRLSSEPLQVLSESYFGSIPDVFRRPNTELFSWLKKHVQARHIRGVILTRYVWCDCWHAEVPRFREWLNVPTVDIDLNSEDALARNRTRIEAFLESLA